MPKIQKSFELVITPEQFLQACSLLELREVELLLDAEIRRAKADKSRKNYTRHNVPCDPSPRKSLDNLNEEPVDITTRSGLRIKDFRKLDPSIERGFLEPHIYGGIIIGYRSESNPSECDLPMTWDQYGRCANWNREDLFINVSVTRKLRDQ